MTRIACRLVSHSAGTHIQQVYTGLSMLNRSGLIDLTQELSLGQTLRPNAAQHLRDASGTHARVVLNAAVTVHFDMHDAAEIDALDLSRCDFYVKRSFSRQYVDTLGSDAAKVLPFGLNYHVLPDIADGFGARRALRLPRPPRGRGFALREALDAGNRLSFQPRVRELESLPDFALPPKVLFLVTAYDPHDNADRSAEKVAERAHGNETRAHCIRSLRKELGPAFVGGFNHNAYTTRHYQDCLVADAGATDKKNYIRTLKAHSICVATTGLHGSIGWKFAEYVACSRAILSERLVYQVPGALAAGKHYLEFTSPDDCVKQALRLMSDEQLRNEMMLANSTYYRASLRPDSLVLNALLTALSRAR